MVHPASMAKLSSSANPARTREASSHPKSLEEGAMLTSPRIVIRRWKQARTQLLSWRKGTPTPTSAAGPCTPWSMRSIFVHSTAIPPQL
eukprot:scaffold4482_cov393-Prasinococcus_capsulatus_cf.AAC.11